MQKLKDGSLIKKYMDAYGIQKLFKCDVFEQMQLFTYRKNEFIVNCGDDLDFFMFFVEGTAKVFTPLKNGKTLMLRFYHPLKLIGEVEMLNGDKATCSIQTITHSSVLALPMSFVRANCREDTAFLQCTLASLADKLSTFSKSSAINLLYSLENRLASYVLATLSCDEGDQEEKAVFKCNLTQLAELLGTSYRHLLRVINHFCEENILKREKGGFTVLDRKALEAVSADLYDG